ncbi:MAG: DUF4386 family protein [Propionibacterium sp.]|nr:DUF4386 family protein [Propionibacterium sp.]
MAASVLADALASIGLGDAQQVRNALTTDPLSFRVGLLVAYVSGLLFLVTAWGLSVALRTVNREWSLLFLLLNVVGVALQSGSMLPLGYVVYRSSPRSWGCCRSSTASPKWCGWSKASSCRLTPRSGSQGPT